MPAFEYQCLDEKGRTKKGLLEGDNARHIRQKLREKGWTPLNVEETLERNTDDGGAPKVKRKLSAADLSVFTRQLATLIQSGLTVEHAFQALSKQNPKKHVKAMVLAIRSKILEGYNLETSFAQFPESFPDLYVASVGAGEKSGHLAEILNQLADYTETRHETSSMIKQALIYPIFLLSFSLVIIGVLLVVAVPQIVGFFTSNDYELPGLTKGLLAMSSFMQSYWWLLIILVVSAFLLVKYLLSKPAIKLKWHQVLLNMPIAKKLITSADSARLASTLSILGQSNVPMVEAMKISSRVMGNWQLRDLVKEAALKVEKGRGISASLSESDAFSPVLLQIISSGEQSGELDDMLSRAADAQDRELRGVMGTIMALIGPFMLLFMGVLILLIVAAMMLPMVSIFEQI